MKKGIIMALIALCALTMSAQEVIRVSYKGVRPTISDFVTAVLFYEDPALAEEEEDDCDSENLNAIRGIWDRHLKNLQQEKGVTLTVDDKNGFVRAEWKYDDDVVVWEMCYWNESDGKHKIFGYNIYSLRAGRHEPGQFDGLQLYRYTNANKTMAFEGYDKYRYLLDHPDGCYVSYNLPRVGKDLVATYWYQNGTKKNKTFKWNGRGFNK